MAPLLGCTGFTSYNCTQHAQTSCKGSAEDGLLGCTGFTSYIQLQATRAKGSAEDGRGIAHEHIILLVSVQNYEMSTQTAICLDNPIQYSYF